MMPTVRAAVPTIDVNAWQAAATHLDAGKRPHTVLPRFLAIRS
jgi:hypothetical protein